MYTTSLMQHGRESTEQDIAWLNGLITAERRAAGATRRGVRSAGAPAARFAKDAQHGKGSARDRRRRQLRVVAGPGVSSSTRMRTRPTSGIDARRPRRLPHPGRRGASRRSTWTPRRSEPTSRRPSSRTNNTIRFAEVPPTGVTTVAGPTFDGLGRYYRETIAESELRRRREGAPRGAGRRGRVVPAGGIRAGGQALRAGRARRVAFVNCLPCSSPRTRPGRRSSSRPGCRSSATTSRARSARSSTGS